MPHSQDIRWHQRFSNFVKALDRLEQAANQENLSDLEEEGLIQRFEYTFELAWNTLQDLLKYKGYTEIKGPNPVIEKAFELGYCSNGKDWINMKKARDKVTHTYNDETAEEIVEGIKNTYLALLKALKSQLEQERSGNQGKLFS